ncbi:methyltransferase [Lentzea pudingi]|uniref:Methyltransferase n=1 Tax=Lentzea pudingi TaxID=1789439 RepID=A0ABQ2HC64_9PSEU|nr:methyltransferase [Lentzea pudingi]GGM73422.1 methyltransferase [Lentzea pudingi]
MSSDLPSPNEVVRELVTGYRRSRVTSLFAELGVADALAAGARTGAEVAVVCGTQAQTTARLLAAAAEIGLVTAEHVLTPAGELLRHDVPGSLASWAVASCGKQYEAWQSSAFAIRTGRPAYDEVFGIGFWEELSRDPVAAAGFDAAMAASVAECCALVRDSADFGGVSTIADVGGGTGTLAATVLRAHPSLRAMVIDLPDVVKRVAAEDVEERCELVGADFFAEVPSGAELYVLCRVLADWSDRDALRLLENCRAAMDAGHRLLVVGEVLRPGEPAARGLLDLHLLMMIGGRERTVDETAELLAQTGFRVTKVTDRARVSMVEAVAV